MDVARCLLGRTITTPLETSRIDNLTNIGSNGARRILFRIRVVPRSSSQLGGFAATPGRRDPPLPTLPLTNGLPRAPNQLLSVAPRLRARSMYYLASRPWRFWAAASRLWAAACDSCRRGSAEPSAPAAGKSPECSGGSLETRVDRVRRRGMRFAASARRRQTIHRTGTALFERGCTSRRSIGAAHAYTGSVSLPGPIAPGCDRDGRQCAGLARRPGPAGFRILGRGRRGRILRRWRPPFCARRAMRLFAGARCVRGPVYRLRNAGQLPGSLPPGPRS